MSHYFSHILNVFDDPGSSSASTALLLFLFAGLLFVPFNNGLCQQMDERYEGPHRPQYHFSAPEGWMGDPSGLVVKDGRYHLFYWGHASTTDLLHWKHHPRALERAMSGSVVIDEQNTSEFGTEENPAWVALFSRMHPETAIQSQHLAYSLDGGDTWTNYKQNPVLDENLRDFRDPQVFWHHETGRWIMVITKSGACKVSFYASDDLIQWQHLSDFGPYGADNGYWECPDMFKLPVKNEQGGKVGEKWLLEVDVQPTGGQYFVGNFDGEAFTMDPHFKKQLAEKRSGQEVSGKLVADFEMNAYGDWKTVGDAFGNAPAGGTLGNQNKVFGYLGERLVNSFRGGDGATGTLTSPEFTLTRPYLSFLISGGNHPGKTEMQLLVDGKIVRKEAGNNSENLRWKHWDISELNGKLARVRIIDRHEGGWGHINVDHLIQTDKPMVHEREDTFWIDYGADFYAVRSWYHYPPEKELKRKVWIAWMGNWQYAHDVPTEDWKGMQSLPRKLSLEKTSDGIRLIQQPVEELNRLRGESWHMEEEAVNESIDLKEKLDGDFDGHSYEIVARIQPKEAAKFGFKLRKGNEEETLLTYDAESKKLSLDRTESTSATINKLFPRVNSCRMPLENGSVTLRIFVDHSTVEVFANGGAKVISSLIYPQPESDGIELFSNGSIQVQSLDIYPMQSVWKTGE